jgi:SAM-dependent methyltransferase
VIEGALRCESCDANYPVVDAVPRLLVGELLEPVRQRFPDFFRRHPEFAEVAGENGANVVAATLGSFTRQFVDLGPPGPELAHQWRENFERNLGRAIDIASLSGKLVLDVGCGYGRHLYVAADAGAETVGIDLSGGVDVAYRNNAHRARSHFVQASILDSPFRDGLFDVVWSFGVLHHLPDPRLGFSKIVPLVKPGGLLAIWVYGYRGMAFTYRLSHLRWLHRRTRTMSEDRIVWTARVVAALLSALYWVPLKAARRLGLRTAVAKLPLTEHLDQSWHSRVESVHDRLAPPVTSFHDREDLLQWFESEGLVDVVVEDTNRRGWRAYGRVPVAARSTVAA